MAVVRVESSAILVTEKMVVVVQSDADLVVQLVGSLEYVSFLSRPMVISGHGGSVPSTLKGNFMKGGGGPLFCHVSSQISSRDSI